MNNRALNLFLSLGMALSLASASAWAQAPVKAIPDFSQFKPIVCDAKTLEDLKAIDKPCSADSFTAWHEDLDKDGTAEWLFFGPSGECGEHGNCPFKILKKAGTKWTLLNPECPKQDCLTWANELYSKILTTVHNGYRDLELSSNDSAFFWVKQVFEWDGKKYQDNPSRQTYYIYDSDKDKLVNVTKAVYDKCSKGGGEGCP